MNAAPAREDLIAALRDFCSVVDSIPTFCFWQARVRLDESISKLPAEVSALFTNVIFDAVLIHVRCLNEFFKTPDEKVPRRDDIRAFHYDGFTAAGAFLSPDEESQIHKRLAHFTTDRARSQRCIWPIGDLVIKALRKADDFLAYLEGATGKAYHTEDLDLVSRRGSIAMTFLEYERHRPEAQPNQPVEATQPRPDASHDQ